MWEVAAALGAVAVAALGGYLADARWLKERRLTEYKAFLLACQAVTTDYFAQPEGERVVREQHMRDAFDASLGAQLVATEATGWAIEATYRALSAWEDESDSGAKHQQVAAKLAVVERNARADFVQWVRRGKRPAKDLRRL